MKNTHFLLIHIMVFLFFIMICPAYAFTAKSLDISVQQNTDANITFDYDLSFAEHFIVFMNIGDPGLELKKALEINYKKPVQILAADKGRAQFVVKGFSSVSEKNGIVTIKTPPLSFTSADDILKKYWFAPFVTVDLSPEVTRITFPDGSVKEYTNQTSIPAINHHLGN